jgi:hypothetical protein
MRRLAGVLTALLLLVAPAAGAELKSEYTEMNANQCTVLDTDEGSVSACPGLRGYPVMVAEGDMAMFVSFGLNPLAEMAAGQTLPIVNRLGGPKMEWLLPADDFTAPPVATILRWYTQREQAGPEGEVLVVTQLMPGATCHIAYVDALANIDANALARQAAEELAGDFDCDGTMPQIYGKFTAFDLE